MFAMIFYIALVLKASSPNSGADWSFDWSRERCHTRGLASIFDAVGLLSDSLKERGLQTEVQLPLLK
jgi:hypothetical protein